MKAKILVAFTFLLPLISFTQIKTGIIQYKIVNNSLFEDEKTSFLYPDDIKKVVNEMTLELKFDDKECSFTAIKPTNCSDENFYSALTSSDIKGFYSKKKNDTLYNWYKSDSDFGNMVIQYEAKLDWKLENESKIIDGYKCFKATCIITDYNYVNSPNSEIIVWYCPKVPIKLGPKRYSGLPGLIFEVTERGTTIKISNLNLNPKEKLDFTPPFKGNIITPLQYKKLIDDYYEEMMKG